MSHVRVVEKRRRGLVSQKFACNLQGQCCAVFVEPSLPATVQQSVERCMLMVSALIRLCQTLERLLVEVQIFQSSQGESSEMW